MNRTVPANLLATVLVLFLSGTAFAQRPPNIVFLVGDDHGYPYYGFMGDENVVTPSMDRAAPGVSSEQVPPPLR